MYDMSLIYFNLKELLPYFSQFTQVIYTGPSWPSCLNSKLKIGMIILVSLDDYRLVMDCTAISVFDKFYFFFLSRHHMNGQLWKNIKMGMKNPVMLSMSWKTSH